MRADVAGKTIVITGGSSGIGAAAARALRRQGAQVVITGRSPRTRTLAEEIGSDYYLVDYARFSDVRGFADALLERYPRIDVLVNNVGGIIARRRLTPDGHEMTLQVNHLSGFLLTNLLRRRLEESNAVVINTSSAAHRFGRIDFDDLERERRYGAFRSYGTAKLMNVLHAMEVNRRFQGVSAASFHPGNVATGFARQGGAAFKLIYETPLKHIFLISPEKGADTLLWLITGEPGRDWIPGEYYDKRKLGRKNPQVSSDTAQRLWDASERLVAQPVPR